MTQYHDVIICGAGSAGIAAAYYLATQHQITNILLVDKHPPLSQTSAKSGENIRTWWPVQPMIDLAERSMTLMEALAAQTNNGFNLEKRGYVYATENRASLNPYLAHYSTLDVGSIRTHDDSTDPARYVPHQQPQFDDQIKGADLLQSGSTIRQHFPHFASTVEAVVHARRAGSISAQQLGMIQLDELKRRGVQLLRGEVINIEVVENDSGRRIGAVSVRGQGVVERYETGAFINAAGPFAGHIAEMMGVTLPIQTVFQQKIAFQDKAGVIPRDAPFTIYLDKQFLPWTDEERQDLTADPALRWLLDEFPGGFHIKPEGTSDSTWIKLGWAYNQCAEPPVWNPDAESRASEFPEVMVRGASRLVPGLSQYIEQLPQPLVHYGGYYTKTAENLPLIGPMEIDGTFIVGALSGFGTMMCCAAGELIAAWVAGTTRPSYADTFSLKRYDDPALVNALAELARQGEL